MKHNMFCFQCEQTAGCTGCTGRAGVCGKQADTANLQDALTGALIALARTIQGKQTVSAKISKQILDGLFTTVTNVNFNDVTIQQRIDAIHRELPAGTADYDMKKVWDAQEDIRSLKSLILFGIRGHGGICLSCDDFGLYRCAAGCIFCQSAVCSRRGHMGHG